MPDANTPVHSSLLKLVETYNNFEKTSDYWEFGYFKGDAWQKLGLIRSQDANLLQELRMPLKEYLSFHVSAKVDEEPNRVQLDSTHLEKSKTFVNAIKEIRQILSPEKDARGGKFVQNLWADEEEMWPLYGTDIETGFLCGLSPVFGIVTTGVHLNIYKRDDDSFRIWVARRSDKKSFAGMYDQCAAGGYQYKLMEPDFAQYGESHDTSTKTCIKREVKEELRGGLKKDWINDVKGPHAIQYAYIRDARSGSLANTPELGVKIAYDLELNEEPNLDKFNTDEVKCIETKSVRQIIELLLADQFKPNCALIMVDFLIRLGCLDDDIASGDDIRTMREMLEQHPAVEYLPHWELDQETNTTGKLSR
ncbi:thiamine pyrophosphokinase [Colletotrichum simmondsii]|uniref:Thiamine pyrophosphokinase n=1 Tax=Colletotrichum simmondsii TaxID=703756 RepID=A0A135THU9_9PEZI|nr:thiamine pyrophosphokinase [Colletotrichum simmondsii]